MKILVINGTEHRGCTHAMKETFLDVVGRDGLMAEIWLPRDCPEFCLGCKACFYEGMDACPHSGYTIPIWDRIIEADLFIFTSPVYVFHVTAQMKALLDHLATKWMAHTPDERMFGKQAVIITNAAGAGMGSTIKDIGDSLRYWGVARVYPIKLGLHESRWEHVTAKRKAKFMRQCEKVRRRLRPTDKVRPSIGIKGRFMVMRIAQRLIHRDLMKRGEPETRDHAYWNAKGWLGRARPWKAVR